jgi:branched-chain amino acid transport system permease protein
MRSIVGGASKDERPRCLPGLLHPDRWLLWFGLLFIASVYFLPTGVVGRLRHGRSEKSAGAPH